MQQNSVQAGISISIFALASVLGIVKIVFDIRRIQKED